MLHQHQKTSYFEIKQRPLAALLIHFSLPLSFVGMPNSIQSAFLQNPSPFRLILGLSALVSSLLLLSLQSALSLATLLWHMQCVHAALVIVEPKVCLM